MSNISPALELKDIYAGYGETEILHGINLSVNIGEIVAIIGPNGAGKSTAIKAILGLLNITCLLYTSPSPRDATLSRMPSSA